MYSNKRANNSKGTSFRLAESVVIEDLGQELLVFVADSSEAFRLTNEAGELVRALEREGQAYLPDSEATRELSAAGIIEVTPASGLSRRGLLKSGAIGLSAGVATLALPTAVHAASYVEVTGLWETNTDPATGAVFYNISLDWPDALGTSVGAGTDPTVLTIVSFTGIANPFTVPVLEYDATGIAGADTVVWESDKDFTGLETQTAVGTFSWGGVAYRMTFSPVTV